MAGYMFVKPALGRQRQEDPEAQGHGQLHSNFERSLGHMRPSLLSHDRNPHRHNGALDEKCRRKWMLFPVSFCVLVIVQNSELICPIQ